MAQPRIVVVDIARRRNFTPWRYRRSLWLSSAVYQAYVMRWLFAPLGK